MGRLKSALRKATDIKAPMEAEQPSTDHYRYEVNVQIMMHCTCMHLYLHSDTMMIQDQWYKRSINAGYLLPGMLIATMSSARGVHEGANKDISHQGTGPITQ